MPIPTGADTAPPPKWRYAAVAERKPTVALRFAGTTAAMLSAVCAASKHDPTTGKASSQANGAFR
jgi:hypothetical protein